MARQRSAEPRGKLWLSPAPGITVLNAQRARGDLCKNNERRNAPRTSNWDADATFVPLTRPLRGGHSGIYDLCAIIATNVRTGERKNSSTGSRRSRRLIGKQRLGRRNPKSAPRSLEYLQRLRNVDKHKKSPLVGFMQARPRNDTAHDCGPTRQLDLRLTDDTSD